MYRLNILIMLLRIYFRNFEFLPQEFQNQRKRTRQCMRHVDLNPIGDQSMRSSELLPNYFRLHLKKICRLLCTISWTIKKNRAVFKSHKLFLCFIVPLLEERMCKAWHKSNHIFTMSEKHFASPFPGKDLLRNRKKYQKRHPHWKYWWDWWKRNDVDVGI